MKLERVEKLNLALSAGAVAVAYALATPIFALSVALGAILEAANFSAMLRSAKQYFAGEIQSTSRWVSLFVLRFLFLGAGIFIMIRSGADVIGLVIGLSLAMPAVAIDSWLHRPAPVDPATLPATPVPAADDDVWDDFSIWRPNAQKPAAAENTETAGAEAQSGDRPGSLS